MTTVRVARLCMAAFLSVMVAVFAVPGTAPAVSKEINTAVATSAPTGTLKCYSATGVKWCYKAYGDQWYVLDNAKDGASAMVAWWMDPLAPVYRFGECFNMLGYGNWGVCNKNYPESAQVQAVGCVFDHDTGDYGACTARVWVQNG